MKRPPGRRSKRVKRHPWTKVLAGLLVSGWLGGAVSGLAVPTTETFNADAEVVEDLTVSESTALDFGKMVAPTDVTQDFTLAPGGSTSTTGTGSFVSGQQPGNLTITGPDESFVGVDSSISGTTVSGCTGGTGTVNLKDITFSSTLVQLVGGTAGVDVGGTLEAAVGASGTFTCSYDVTVFFTSPAF